MKEGSRRIVLASTSAYRAELLRRILVDFEICAPEVDEAPRMGELPMATATRLAREKASAVVGQYPGRLVIGSDQVADLDGALLGKPGTLERAKGQLTQCSARVVTFHTAVCIADSASGQIVLLEATDTTRVVFRALDANEIARYLAIDRPLDCAGSFKVEHLGISLFERVESTDPTALIGLPLIALCRLLREAGISIP